MFLYAADVFSGGYSFEIINFIKIGQNFILARLKSKDRLMVIFPELCQYRIIIGAGTGILIVEVTGHSGGSAAEHILKKRRRGIEAAFRIRTPLPVKGIGSNGIHSCRIDFFCQPEQR